MSDSEDEIRALLQRAPTACSPVCDGELDEIIGVVKARDCCLPSTRAIPGSTSQTERARHRAPRPST